MVIACLEMISGSFEDHLQAWTICAGMSYSVSVTNRVDDTYNIAIQYHRVYKHQGFVCNEATEQLVLTYSSRFISV